MWIYVLDCFNLFARWMHLITGIAWIGASFYFNWLENHLNRKFGNREEIAGHLWAVHGGGFYFLEKYKVAPSKIPESLHWFKWEAYLTWVSGFALLCGVYFANAQALLIDVNKSTVEPYQAVGIAILLLVIGWWVYDSLCKTRLVGKKIFFSFIYFGFLILCALFLDSLFQNRAVYILIGAMLGTNMVANVFFVIIPSQKNLVESAKRGHKPDPEFGKKALLRSRHNNYMTLPVLFLMISNHFPQTFAHTNHLFILSSFVLIGVMIRHYFNIRHESKRALPLLVLSLALLLTLFVYMKPAEQRTVSQSKVSFSQVRAVFNNRCIQCHSRWPSDDIFKIAPNGVYYDTAEEIKAKAVMVKQRAVDTDSMPLGNKTEMTNDERILVGHWIDDGASID